MKILAIDPGTNESAWLVFNTQTRRPERFAITENSLVLAMLRPSVIRPPYINECEHLAIEMIASYGMAVGKEVFETCLWIGQFIEGWHGRHTRVYRKDVKMHLCGSLRAKDANINKALADMYGGEGCKGTKHAPGPLHGISKHMWAALAVAVTHAASAPPLAVEQERRMG